MPDITPVEAWDCNAANITQFREARANARCRRNYDAARGDVAPSSRVNRNPSGARSILAILRDPNLEPPSSGTETVGNELVHELASKFHTATRRECVHR